jgi:hypothetical protein
MNGFLSIVFTFLSFWSKNLTTEESRKIIFYQAWWYIPVIPALRSLRQKDCKFKANLGWIGRPILKYQYIYFSGTGIWTLSSDLLADGLPCEPCPQEYHSFWICQYYPILNVKSPWVFKSHCLLKSLLWILQGHLVS